MTDSSNIAQRWHRLRAALPPEVTLMAAGKGQEGDSLRAAYLAGARLFGENYVQEAARKWPGLREELPEARLHLIGRLQTNKLPLALELFDGIESIDRPELLLLLAKAQQAGRRLPELLLQVNIGREPQKGGVNPDSLPSLLAEAARLNLPIGGLMAIPPLGQPAQVFYEELAGLADAYRLKIRSMGMSSDWQAAIAAGSTRVRIGTALFGVRPAKLGEVRKEP